MADGRLILVFYTGSLKRYMPGVAQKRETDEAAFPPRKNNLGLRRDRPPSMILPSQNNPGYG